MADGDVVAYNSSDMRLKNNLQVIGGALDKIDGINGYEFDWNDKSPSWARERGHDVGVVAQEVETVSSGLIFETIDRDPDDSTKEIGTTKNVKYSILYMKAFKALQEAMAKIEVLETKVAALEAA